MREHHALRLASRAGRVNDRRQFVRTGFCCQVCGTTRLAFLELLRPSTSSCARVKPSSAVTPSGSKKMTCLIVGTLAEYLFQFQKLLATFNEENTRA